MLSFDSEKRICRLMVDYILDLTADIPAEDFNKQVIADSISPAWVLGHLCYETVRTASWLDVELPLDKAWEQYFSQGTSALDVPEMLEKGHLRATFKKTIEAFADALSSVDEEKLRRPNPSKVLADYFPEVQHDVSHTLTSHLAIHGGHLGMWRKAYGLKNKYGR